LLGFLFTSHHGPFLYQGKHSYVEALGTVATYCGVDQRGDAAYQEFYGAGQLHFCFFRAGNLGERSSNHEYLQRVWLLFQLQWLDL
jgi:hypothetical protein